MLINYLTPGQAFGLLMALAVAALVINWVIISITHLMFRKAKRQAGEDTSFKSWGYPFTNYLCLLFVAGIVLVMWLTPGIRISVMLMPAWVIVLVLAYLFKRRAKA